MTKIKIKCILKNRTENTEFSGEFLGIKTDNKIKYSDNNIKSVISIDNDKLVIERKSSDYLIKLFLSLRDITKGIYDIYGLNKFSLDIQTRKLNIENGKIESSYFLSFDKKEKVEIDFNLEWEEIK